MLKILFCSIGLCLSLHAQAFVHHGEAEIQFRFDSHRPYKVPPAVTLGTESPILSNSREVFLKFADWDNDFKPGIMRMDRSGEISVVKMKEGLLPTGLSFNEKTQKLFFEIIQNFQGLGIFTLDTLLSRVVPVWNNEKVQFSSEVFCDLTFKSQCLYRGTTFEGEKFIALLDVTTGESQILLGFGSHRGQSISYVFTPVSSSNGNYFAVKVRHGERGQVSESQPDSIYIFSWSTELLPELVAVVRDRDGNEQSEIATFDNSFALNNNGSLAFMGRNSDDKRSLWHKRLHQPLKVILNEGVSTQQIHNFPADLNDKEEIVFRARTIKGESIFFHHPTSGLQILLRWGQRLKSDLGDLKAGPPRREDPSFFLSPRINQRGDVLVGTLVTQSEAEENSGLAFYLFPKLEN